MIEAEGKRGGGVRRGGRSTEPRAYEEARPIPRTQDGISRYLIVINLAVIKTPGLVGPPALV